MKKRDQLIRLSATQELNLSTRSIKSKKVYSRKDKHKSRGYARDLSFLSLKIKNSKYRNY